MSESNDENGCGAILGIIFILGLIVLFGISFFGGLGRDYSDGARSGLVNKLSRKGIIWKCHEGELTIGTGYTATQVWDFSVTDPAIAAKVEQAMNSGKRVTLTYRQWLIKPISQDTKNDIIKVEETQ